jgi:hypothetical protein
MQSSTSQANKFKVSRTALILALEAGGELQRWYHSRS